jgi:mannose-6-phosphate isomerase-like protein (cupin superfamily)
MAIHDIADVLLERERSGRACIEFQRAGDLSTGVYVLAAGGVDRQLPHTEDEIYYVLTGRARITVAGDTSAVGAGSVVFVGAGVAHRFHDITEELRLLVVFGPAEGSRAER